MIRSWLNQLLGRTPMAVPEPPAANGWHPPTGWRLWTDEPPPLSVIWVNTIRRGEDTARLMNVRGSSPLFNIADLWWGDADAGAVAQQEALGRLLP